MKHFYVFMTALTLTSMVTLGSCKKNKAEEPDKSEKGTATASVQYDNKTISFSSIKDSSMAFLEWVEAEQLHNFYVILKDDITGIIIESMIYPVKEGTGTYPLAEGLSQNGWALTNVHTQGRSASAEHTYGSLWQSSEGILTKSEGILSITSMTDEKVKGTFNAILYYYNEATREKKKLTITQGAFDVPLKKRNFDFSNVP